MGNWVLADLDNIIGDFMGQLSRATQQGWHRSRPDHYRAIVAALESALRERSGLLASRAIDEQAQRATSMAELCRPEAPLPVAWRLAWRPLPCLVPSRSQ